ncbi:MAG: tRNA/rRNA methyltransferase [Chitinophagales bacterium]|nr:MAG: tRNA/rRNA methyltransferase [Chitinophagales bacterium]
MRKLTGDELNRLSPQAFKEAKKNPCIIVLDNVRSRFNVGAVFRTADAFRVEAIYLCGITPVPPHREIRKTALGAEETVAWKYFPSAEEAVLLLKAENRMIIVAEQTDCSIPLQHFNAPQNKSLALIFGNEVHGVSEAVIKLADASVEIPQFGSKHSLNIAVSAAIVVWEFWKQVHQK